MLTIAGGVILGLILLPVAVFLFIGILNVVFWIIGAPFRVLDVLLTSALKAKDSLFPPSNSTLSHRDVLFNRIAAVIIIAAVTALCLAIAKHFQ